MNSSTEPSLGDVVSLFKDYSGDETGGVHAIRGFTFQVWQAVLETIRAHATGEDYAVVLEWQQDIALLDSSRSPGKVRFIQIKKNESSNHWTLAALIAPKDGATDHDEGDESVVTLPPTAPVAGAETAAVVPPEKKRRARPSPKPSILSKLYYHRRRFHAVAPTRLVFASNAPFYVHVDDADERTMSTVHLAQLPLVAREKVEAALRKQLVIADGELLDLEDFTLEVTNCPTEEAHKFAIGELVEHCMLRKIEPQVVAPFVAVCLLASYIQLRAGKASFAKDFTALLARAVTRDEVSTYFAAANDSHISTQDLVEEIVARLNLEGADYEMVESMQREVNLSCSAIMNRAGAVWPSVKALAELSQVHDRYKSFGQVNLRLIAWLRDFRALAISGSSAFNDGYLFCFMAMILKNARPIQHLSTSASDSKSEGEK